LIAPVIPKSWRGFKATRKFRGVTYNIEAQRAGNGNQVSLEVNGAPVQGNLVPLPAPGTKTVSVKATLR
jgi:cellobiose phosphorylase